MADSDTLVRDLPAETPKTDSFPEIGIEIGETTPEALERYGYKDDVEGVLITAVKADSPAAEKGLREGLVIQMVGAEHVKSPAEFREALKSVSLAGKGIRMLVSTPNRGAQFVVVKGAAK